MKINFSVKSKIIVNGKEYGSVEEMPAEIRAAYRKVGTGSPRPGHAVMLETEKTKLSFNGREYASEDAMPEEERELYKVVMQAMEKEGISIPDGLNKNMWVPRPDIRIPEGSGKPIVPESSFSPRKLLSFTAIFVFLLGVTYLLLVSGR